MKSTIMRVDRQFKEMINNIRNERRRIGKDKKDLSDPRLTLAISRIPNIENFVVESNIMEDKLLKGLPK